MTASPDGTEGIEGTVGAMSSMTKGQRGRVAGFDLAPEQRQALLEMGLTVGAQFEVVRFAPMGDPVEIRVRGYNLSLRLREAAGIRVEIL